MPLAASCLQFVGSLLYVRPGYGWGWRRSDDTTAALDYAQVEAAGGFFLAVKQITSSDGELRHVIGRVLPPHSLFADCWAACAVMLVGTFDFHEHLCLRYDLSIGPTPPTGEWPEVVSGGPIYGGYGTIAATDECIEQFLANATQKT